MKAAELEGEVERELQRVVASEVFAASPRLCTFLRYVVHAKLNGQERETKESLIGVHVFERQPGYDPKSDAIVRVEARRLRKKLDEYYEARGPASGLRIRLPKGGYVPEFEVVALERNAQPEAGRGKWIYAAAAVLVATLGGWLLLREGTAGAFISQKVGQGAGQGQLPMPLTSMPGVEANPAFHPDGKSIAFVGEGPAGGMDLFIQELGSDQAKVVAVTPEDEHGVAWSPDGKQLAFFRHGEKTGNQTGNLAGNRPANLPRRMRLLVRELERGQEMVIGEVTEGTGTLATLSWSVDGKFLVATDQEEGQPSRIVQFWVESKQRGWLTSPPANVSGDSCPSVSPDGTRIAFRRAVSNEVEHVYLLRMSRQGRVEGETRLDTRSWGHRGHDWTADGKALVASLQKGSTLRSLWLVPADGSPMRRLMTTSLSAVQPAVARSGKRLAWVTNLEDMNLWARASDGSGSSKLRIGSTYFDMAPQYSPDGKRIAFRSNRTGISAIWIADRAGNVERKLVDFGGAQVSAPRWSPDGRQIVFESRARGSSDLYVIDAVNSGAKPVLLLGTENQEVLPWWSRDGKWIYYSAELSGKWRILKVDAGGRGAPVVMSEKGGFGAVESADGRWLYYARNAKEGGLYRMPVVGGAEESVLPELAGPLWGNWVVAGNAVYYFEQAADASPEERAVMKRFDLTTKKATRLFGIQKLPARWDTGLAISPDGAELLFAQLDRTGSDIFWEEGFVP